MPVPGSTIGPYRVDRELGRGGMGVVFLARDTRLDRAVALKALPEGVVADADSLARFEREAKSLAALQHPNIAAIYGVEQDGGARYLALEYVEGETLAERLLRGPIAWRDLLDVAVQIAAGMEAAHEAGIIHRDLKPANVMVTRDDRVKILDFGLAKAPAAGSGAGDALPHSPTLTHSPATIPGVILGTAAYLSPEQARGKPVDRRTDIWAFGCILFECLTGAAPFAGETVSDMIARILEREPDWSALPADTPPRVRALVERCLRKDPRERLRDIGDARLELIEARTSPTDPAGAGATTAAARTGPGAPALWIGAAIAAVIGTLLVLAAARALGPRAPEPEVRRFSISVPQATFGFSHPASISPDGRHLLYSAANRLWVRSLDRFDPTEIAGTEGARSYFWSPDSRRIGYFREGRLWAADRTGAGALAVTDPVQGIDPNGGDWGADGSIVYALYHGGLYVVPAAGGSPRLLLRPDTMEVDFHHPQFLPDGRHLIAVAHRKTGAQALITVAYPGGERRNLAEFENLSSARYAASGHLLLTFEIGNQEFQIVPFSVSRLRLSGKPIRVPGGLFPSASGDGVLAYFLGSSRAMREFVWVDRQGRVERLPMAPQPGLDDPAISPDGRSIAAVAYEGGNTDLWLFDAARGTKRRLVTGPGDQVYPRWFPDGSRIAYLDRENYLASVMEVPVDRGAPPRRVGPGFWFTITSDGAAVVHETQETRSTLVRRELREGSATVTITPGPETVEVQPALSPDGRWLAYASDEPGTFEVFVQRYPDGTTKRQISLHAGSWPFWARDGRALYYWEKGTLMEVPVGPGGSPEFGAPRKLFAASDAGVELETDFRPPACAASPDGRFLMVRRVPGDPTSGILLVQNWTRELDGRGR